MANLLFPDNGPKLGLEPFSPLQNQRGSAAVDYAVILVFVVLVVIAVIASLEDHTDVVFDATTTVIGDFGSIKPK